MVATIEQEIDETFDQLNNIESLCNLFFTDRQFTIAKNIATTLRLLLTGSSGHVGLMQKVLPVGKLWPLRKVPASETPKDMLVLPAKVMIDTGQAQVQFGNGTVTTKELQVPGGSAVASMEVGEMFDASVPAMPLAKWLMQSFLRPNWTMRKFIGTVTNKDGGAHHDPNSDLLAMQKWGHLHWHLTAGIARSVLPQVREQLAVAYPHHVRSAR